MRKNIILAAGVVICITGVAIFWPTLNTIVPGGSETLAFAKITAVQNGTQNIGGTEYPNQTVTVHVETGPDAGQDIAILNNGLRLDGAAQQLAVGETVIVGKNQSPDGPPYFISDRYRIPALAIILFIFVLFALAFGRLKGLTSVIGLAVSIGIIIFFILPQILAGHDPLFICTIGAFLIAVPSLYLAHGLNRKTTIALGATIITLAFAVVLSVLFTSLTKLIGAASDQTFYVQLATGKPIDYAGVFIGGIILASLGILDDVTVGQVATVLEIHNTDRSLKFNELYKRGLRVGQEHIASLINTLALIYAGASLPLLLYLALNNAQLPVWFIVNQEPIAEEIVRTLVGSIALIAAVPIATALAAWLLPKRKNASTIS